MEKLDRKAFLKNSLMGCLTCCGALAGLQSLAAQASPSAKPAPAPAAGLEADLGRRVVEGAGSPAWRRAEKSLSWIKNLLQHLDEQLDEPTRVKLLNACGRSCFLFAEGVADDRPIPPEAGQGFLQWLEKNGYKVERTPGGNRVTIEFGYRGEQNPQGLSLREGYCLCPIVEKDLGTLSPSYCNCSAGYVKELVERNSGFKVESVEVVESLKRGGQDCRFRLVLLTA